MQGFGQQSLLTAAEEKVLSNAVQRLIALEAVQAEAVVRLGRPVTEKEWMAECGQTSIHAFRKAIKVSFPSISPVLGRISVQPLATVTLYAHRRHPCCCKNHP